MKKQMENLKYKVTAFILLCFCMTRLLAQETIPVSGGNATGNGGTVSYSVGQVVSTTNTGTTASVAQGVQQPFEISVVAEIEDAKRINLTILAYPNPTTNYLILEVADFSLSPLSFSLYDIQGKLLQNKKITDSQTTIDISNLVSANYFIKVAQGNKELKMFKIVKR